MTQSNPTLSLFRCVAVLIMALAVLTQSGCSSTANRRTFSDVSRPGSTLEDLSKIRIDFVTAADFSIPMDPRKMLLTSLTQQLEQENRLQTDDMIHSLSLKVMVLSFEDDIIEVQGELYDGDAFLAYSRVKRLIPRKDGWLPGIDLVAQQLLDELMNKMRLLQQTATGPSTGRYVTYRNNYYGNNYNNSYYNDPYYISWGWWRHHRDHDDHQNHHDHPDPKPVPKPEPHWVPGAIIEALPRSHHVAEEISVRKTAVEEEEEAPASSSSSTGRSIFGIFESGSGSNSSPSSDSSSSHSSSSSESSSGSSSGSSYSPPQSHSEPHQHSSSSSSSSSSSYAPPSSQHSEPASAPSPSSSGSVSGSAPSSHHEHHERHKKD
jgi:hypothetical protein